MDRRTWIFVLFGSLTGGTATLLVGLSLDPYPVACGGFLTAFSGFCPGSSVELLWFELSQTEVIIWSVIFGMLTGALLGLVVDWLVRRWRPIRGTRWGIGTAVIGSVLAACTSLQPAPSSSPIQEPDPFARYFFSASEMVGVLEVSQSPPSICYSTQSSPARPISIIPSRFVSGPPPGAPTVSYTPRGNDFCARTVDPALAEALIFDPSGYLIRWRPEDGAPAVSSCLAE
jgi:hypothetical protein